MAASKKLSAQDRDALLATLGKRFAKHMHRHKGLAWDNGQAKLEAAPVKLLRF